MRFLAALAVGLVTACASTSIPPGPASGGRLNPTPVPTTASSTSCPQGDPLGTHTYHADRLLVLQACITATGTIDAVKAEPDGDDHIRIHLDPQFAYMLNSVNVSKQHGDLVVEPECMHTVSQADAVFSCSNYTNPLTVPTLHSHVSVTGPWVTDKDHGWNEIHPAYSIVAA